MRTAVNPMESTLRSSNLRVNRVSGILVINNSSEVPTIRSTIGGLVNGRPFGNVGPSRYITVNTTVRTNMLNNRIRKLLLLSMAPLSLNIRAVNNIVAGVVSEGAAVPAGGDRVFSATTSGRARIRVGILRNRHRFTHSGGRLNLFTLAKVTPTVHNVPRVRIAFSVSTGNVIGMSTGSLNANGRRGVAVDGSASVDGRSVSGTIGRTRRFTTRSGGHHRTISTGGRTRGVICRTRGLIDRDNSGVPRSSGGTVGAGITTLGRTVSGSSTTLVNATGRSLRGALGSTTTGLCRRTTPRNNTPSVGNTRPGNNGPANGGNKSPGMCSTSFASISSGGWFVLRWRVIGKTIV